MDYGTRAKIGGVCAGMVHGALPGAQFSSLALEKPPVRQKIGVYALNLWKDYSSDGCSNSYGNRGHVTGNRRAAAPHVSGVVVER